MKPSSLIKETSDRLIDQEPGFTYLTWKRSQLLAAFNWGLSIITDLKPELFTKTRRIPLPTGSTMQVEGCTRFMPPYLLLDKKGNFVRDLSQGAVRGPLRTVKLCGSDAGPYYFNRLGESSFEIFPAIEDDTGLQVEGQCMSSPQAEHEDQEIDVPNYLRAALLELMMHYAHMYDTEAVASRDRAAVHWNNAMVLLGQGAKRNAT